MSIGIHEFSTINRRRCEAENGFHHKISSWSLSDWMTALVGEVGEAANIIKKLNRIRDDVPGNARDLDEHTLRDDLRDELADAYCYLDLLAQAAGFDLETEVINKFRRVSERIGYKP